MERWTFLILAADDGSPDGIRMTLRAGDDESAWPRLQVGLDGTEVAVDARPHDYEAPEWKAQQIFQAGNGRWDALKDQLRADAPS